MLNWRDPKNPKSGGAERVCEAYWRGLADQGHEVWWYANGFPGGASRDQVGTIDIARGGGMFTSVRAAMEWYSHQPRFDLVIDQHHGIPWYAPWWVRTRCLAYIHEILGPIWKSFYPWPFSWIGRIQEHWTLHAYREIPFWTGSESTRRALHGRGIRRVTAMPYGVDTRVLTELPQKPLTQPWQCVTVSRLAPNKRIEHALMTVASLRNRGVEATLKIVGRGESEQSLRKEIQRLNAGSWAELTGPLDESEKDQLLARSHWLLHTSVREGWGLNVTEANAMGTPGAVYPVPGLVDSTLANRTGLISREETPASLADSLMALRDQEDQYQRMRRAAWLRAESLHWDHVLPRVVRWLEACASGTESST